jgi:hypothetical protein
LKYSLDLKPQSRKTSLRSRDCSMKQSKRAISIRKWLTTHWCFLIIQRFQLWKFYWWTCCQHSSKDTRRSNPNNGKLRSAKNWRQESILWKSHWKILLHNFQMFLFVDTKKIKMFYKNWKVYKTPYSLNFRNFNEKLA